MAKLTPTDSLSQAADFWRYDIGVNIIPADTRIKETHEPWREWQDKAIPEKLHQKWKSSGAFKLGIALILGKVWHNSLKKGLYLIGIDLDNQKAIEEVAVDGLEDLAKNVIVEQHKDDPTKAHVLLYSHKPFPKKSNDNNGHSNLKLDVNEVPAIEVKGLGSHGLLFVTPSIHKNGHPYEIIGTRDPVIVDDFVFHIDNICKKYSISYLDRDARSGNGKAFPHIQDLFKSNFKIFEGHNRHEGLLRVMESLIARNCSILSQDQILSLAQLWNNQHCSPPLNEKEFKKQWKCAVGYIARNKTEEDTEKTAKSNNEPTIRENSPLIKAITEAILKIHHFVTIEENGEILVYDNGVYTHGGEVVIEKTAESLYDYKVTNRHLAEIKGHIMRLTYHKLEELDSDVNIINLKNGLYNIESGEFREHSPYYLSITQKPIVYNPAAKPKLLGKYFQQVLYPSEIRTAIEVMAYSLYKDNPFEIIVKLFGYGANGKSVFTGLLTSLHGAQNVSNVPLSEILKNRFALSDLENKFVNIDTELPSATIHDTTVLKKLTGRQPVRIERKNQRAYDAILYAKLFFSANKIPETEDESDAYFRREIILSFPNRFEDGKGADPDLLRKLTTEEELSGIFNILVITLRRVLDNGIFIREKSIEQRREKHELAVNPIQYFLKEAIVEDSVESDHTYKETLYQAYKRFCNEHRLAVESLEGFCKILKNKIGYLDGRESSGPRRRFWRGVKLAEKYNIAEEQKTLEGIIS